MDSSIGIREVVVLEREEGRKEVRVGRRGVVEINVLFDVHLMSFAIDLDAIDSDLRDPARVLTQRGENMTGVF